MSRSGFAIFACAGLLLAGCTQEIYYRQGATLAEVQRAEDACALQSEAAAPYKPQSRIIPESFVSERKVCDAQGNCEIVPVVRSFPKFETVDLNAERRVLLARTCMAQKGYDRVSLPYCDAAQRQGATGVTRTLPALSVNSCIIPRGSNAYQIVTP